MPKCNVCFKLYHPDWMIEKTVRGDEIVSCLFCHTEKDKLTVVDENDNIKEIVTKEQAARNYLKYLDDLSKNENIAKILGDAKEKKKLKDI